MLQDTEPVVISSLVNLECTNAILLRVFRRERTERQAALSIEAFESDLAQGILRLQPVPASVWDTATRLAKKHSSRIGTRSLDILQVAIALALRVLSSDDSPAHPTQQPRLKRLCENSPRVSIDGRFHVPAALAATVVVQHGAAAEAAGTLLRLI
jgi:hypothetical protein